MTKKILAVLCTAALLTSAASTSAFAADTVTDDKTVTDDTTVTENTEDGDETNAEEEETLTIAKILAAAQEDENGFFAQDTPSSYTYLTEDNFEVIQIARVCYAIELEAEATLPEDVVESFEGMFTTLDSSDETVKITEGEPTLSLGSVSGVSLHTTEDGTYELWFSPSAYSLDEEALATYLQTIPEFVAVTEDLYGYSLSEANDCTIDFTKNAPISVTVAEGAELTAEDLADIEGISAESAQDNVYLISFDETLTQDSASVLAVVKALQAVEKVKSVSVSYIANELGVNADDYLIDHSPEAFFTRGDCDSDAKITINDAYQALLEYASVSAGLDSTLEGLARVAANVDGSDKIEITDAYHILLYYSYQSAGLKPQWSELLTESEEDTPAVATGTTELTEDAQ